MGEDPRQKSHTPLFQLSQNLSSPWSKPMVKRKEPAKMLVTKTPVEKSVSFRKFGQGSVILFRRAMAL